MSWYSDDLRDYMFSADPDVAEIDTVEFRHPGFLDGDGHNVAVRIANRLDDFTATLEDDAQMNAGETVVFQGAAFKVTRPESSDQGSPVLQLTVANVSRVLVPYLDIAAAGVDPVFVCFRLFLSDDTSAPQFIVDYLNAKSVGSGILEVTMSAGFEDILNRPFGKAVYNTRDNPGLDR